MHLFLRHTRDIKKLLLQITSVLRMEILHLLSLLHTIYDNIKRLKWPFK
jgi:hypothetical protein